MEEYDSFARTRLPEKIPDWHNKDHRRRVGDAIYAFSNGTVIQREGVHGPENQTTDLNGGNALLSREFVYFGANAPELPSNLAGIAQNRQGHRTTLNDPYVDDFASWVRGLAGGHASVLGKPLLDLFADASCARWCAAGRGEQDDEDDEIA